MRPPIRLAAGSLVAVLLLSIAVRPPAPLAPATAPAAGQQAVAPTTTDSAHATPPFSGDTGRSARPLPAHRPPGMLGGGEPVTLASIPAGSALRRDLDRLAPGPLDRALTLLSRATFGLADTESLRADPAGGIYFVCTNAPLAAALAEPATLATAEPVALAAAVPISTPPLRHSRPGSTKVLYLDFNGAIVTGTAWNTASAPSYDCLPFDTDGAPDTFSDAEQATIVEIWQRVAEDYAPFDIDVTTEEPATSTRRTAHALITRPQDRNGVALPSANAAGVAYLDVFGDSNYANYRPAFIYFTALPSGGPARADYVAEAVAHEIGHNMGLSHDGTSRLSYYAGHGSGDTSWGPIMGTGYNRNVSQWSKGEYYDANNTEDDLAILDSKLSRRTDDRGSTPATAEVLPDTGATVATVGLIERADDRDLLRFASGAGTITLTATPFLAPAHTRGGDADLMIELLDATGNVLATAAPTGTTGATLSATVPVGTFFARLSTTGAGTPLATSPTGYTIYACLGQYTLEIDRTVPPAPGWPTFQAVHFSPAELTDDGISGPDADPDADGCTNLAEYAFARDPRQNDPGAPLRLVPDEAGLSLLFQRFVDTADLVYTLERSTDLEQWAAVPASDYASSVVATTGDVPAGLSSPGIETLAYLLTNTAAQREFYRLRVSIP